ncbi:MAG: response regulator [Polyangiaceae bacterium]
MTNQRREGQILLVEDDPELRESMVDILQDEGYRVAAANDGIQALAALAAGPKPNIILLDMMMPKMNGAQFRAEQLKNPQWMSIPVVILTAHVMSDYERESLHADAFITKPFEIPTLLDVIVRILERGMK